MSGNGQDHQIPEALEDQDNGQEEEDDDFGEFEGFEGGVERLQAQPAPSPWATFPDLLPVQTSPATPAEDGQPSTSRGQGAVPRDPGWPLAGPSHEPQRTLNPPDVSLGTNQAAGGRVTPDNVHDAALAVVMDHIENGLDARIPIAQVERLNQQLEHAEYDRSQLEQQIEHLRQRNNELEDRMNQQGHDFQNLVNQMGEMLEGNRVNLEQWCNFVRENISSNGWSQNLEQIKQDIGSVKQYQNQERKELKESIETIARVREEVREKLNHFETTIDRGFRETEERLSKKLDEHCQEVRAAIGTVAQQTAEQVASNLSQVVSNAVQSSGGGESQTHNLLQSIKTELEKHKDHQKRALEEERKRQLTALSSALQSALQKINSEINNSDSKPKDDSSSS